MIRKSWRFLLLYFVDSFRPEKARREHRGPDRGQRKVGHTVCPPARYREHFARPQESQSEGTGGVEGQPEGERESPETRAPSRDDDGGQHDPTPNRPQ